MSLLSALKLAIFLGGGSVALVSIWQCIADQLARWCERQYDDPLTPALWAAGCIRRVK